MEVFISSRRIHLSPSKSIGKGGEADIYDIGNKALKLFKQSNHPDLEGLPEEQKAASARIREHQKKLPAFPKNLPSKIIAPEELATDKNNLIIGYSMELIKGAEVLLRYGERGFRQAISNKAVIKIFQGLYETVFNTHASNVVIGDFNDLNVLVLGEEAYMIDADSFQFGKFLCRVFTTKFVDPMLCDPNASSLMLVKPHSPDSDWYAFSIMLMQSLLFVDPYGGVYMPKNKANFIPHSARPLHRITVFHKDVRYPKPAIPYKVLPDDLLQYFYNMFEKDKRGQFTKKLIEELNWTKCIKCGMEHARNICPSCAEAAPAAIKEVETIRGEVTATRIFKTNGIILFAAYQDGNLYWLYHENEKFKREDKSMVISGSLEPGMRFRIKNRETLIGMSGQVINFKEKEERIGVDNYITLPIFDANNNHIYWIKAGQLMRDGVLGAEYIGDVLQGQTLFWIGQSFGFGFYRAGQINVAFVFDSEKKGINDSVKIPPLRGQLIDSTCTFTKELCWFFASMQESGKIINYCSVIRYDGSVLATAQANAGESSWLSSLRGKCAAAKFLLVATDEGIIRVELQGNRIIETKKFPDTEPFVDSGCHLFPGNQGLYVVHQKEIYLLKIK